MATVDNFEELDVWKLARALTGKVYRLSRLGLFAKDYGFRDQICRAAVSIVSNIAEGFERRSKNQFLIISLLQYTGLISLSITKPPSTVLKDLILRSYINSTPKSVAVLIKASLMVAASLVRG